MLIHVDHLTHTYAPGTPLARTALHDISLEVLPGQRLGVVGATGSGKSTLVQHIAGLLKPSAGRVLLDGTPAHQNTRAARARRLRIGLAFQYPEDQIFERTVYREVAFGLRAYTRGIKRTGRNTGHTETPLATLPEDQVRARTWSKRTGRNAGNTETPPAIVTEAQVRARTRSKRTERNAGDTETPSAMLTKDQVRARVHWALEQVGLDPTAIDHRSPLTLSGGEMRRVALASVLCTQPEVLILDEPTAGLDPQGRESLLASIQSWGARTSGSTLLVISHNLGHLAHLVDRVIVLARGSIVADGPARRVLGDRNLLQAAGLEVPLPVELLHALHKAGWAIRTDCLLAQEAVAEIARAHRLREDT